MPNSILDNMTPREFHERVFTSAAKSQDFGCDTIQQAKVIHIHTRGGEYGGHRTLCNRARDNWRLKGVNLDADTLIVWGMLGWKWCPKCVAVLARVRDLAAIENAGTVSCGRIIPTDRNARCVHAPGHVGECCPFDCTPPEGRHPEKCAGRTQGAPECPYRPWADGYCANHRRQAAAAAAAKIAERRLYASKEGDVWEVRRMAADETDLEVVATVATREEAQRIVDTGVVPPTVG